MPQLPFIPDQRYNRRRDIHALYGGNWQSGICPTKDFPYIFIFSGKSGEQHGYADRWDNANVYTYTGEGQKGDMEFTRGNLALYKHKENGKRVFLFESEGRGMVRFKCEVEVYEADFEEIPDTTGQMRLGIKFFFNRIGAYIPYQPGLFDGFMIAADPEVAMHSAPSATERNGLVTSRVGQGAYRKRIIHRWEYKCAVTNYDKLDILIASHIVPWSAANDLERLDVHNGILLSPTYDALFDRHLISFDNNGNILLDESIEARAFAKIHVSGKERIHSLSSNNIPYLERHREIFNSIVY